MELTKSRRDQQHPNLDSGDLKHLSFLLEAATHDFLEIAIQNGPLSGPVRQKQREASRGLQAIDGIREQLAEILWCVHPRTNP